MSVNTIRPAADIVDGAEELLLLIDLPGVPEQDVVLSLERDLLTVEASVELMAPEGLKPLVRESARRHYRRQFRLGPRASASDLTAALTDGVLRVRVPKPAPVEPRRIAIATS